MTPKISVLMGIYNCAGTLPEAIDSILCQTEQDFELILCDDGSTDHTYAVAEGYARRHPEQIVLLKNPRNMGLHATLNRCLEVSRGEYIARMDGDDISLPERFAVQRAYLDQHADCAILGTGYAFFDETGIWGTSQTNHAPTLEDAFYNHAYMHPTIMMRRSALEAVGGYTVSKITRRAEDYDLFCKLAEHGFAGNNIPQILLHYREGRAARKKRKFIHRLEHAQLIHYWHKRTGVGSPLQCLRPVVAGLIPYPILQLLRKSIYRK